MLRTRKWINSPFIFLYKLSFAIRIFFKIVGKVYGYPLKAGL